MKRIIITLGVFLLLGAIVNVAVAWGTVRGWPSPLAHGRWGSMRSFGPSHEDDFQWVVSMHEIACATTLSFRVRWWYPEHADIGDTLVDAPLWSVAADPPPHDRFDRVYFEEARGWPYLSLMWRKIDVPIASPFATGVFAQTTEWQGALFLDEPDDNISPVDILPFMPIWPGFAINTFFYAAILWLLFAAPFTLRRWRRIRRGLCAKCAYPVGTSDVCTECGQPVRVTSRVPHVIPKGNVCGTSLCE